MVYVGFLCSNKNQYIVELNDDKLVRMMTFITDMNKAGAFVNPKERSENSKCRYLGLKSLGGIDSSSCGISSYPWLGSI